MVKISNIVICLAGAVLSGACARPLPLDRVAACLDNAGPGDTVLVKAGNYSDLDLRWKGKGSADAPVVVMPESEGTVIIGGESTLHISGVGLEVRGLVFRDGRTDKRTVIEFKDGDNLAENCRLADCVVDSYNPVRRDISYSYVHLYGRNNRVDHCSFLGKKNLGVTLIVMLNYNGCLDNHHSIDHNYFGPRPVYGSNGAETIRVGTSQQCMENSHTSICQNFFDRCNGEVEVISIKSSENVVEENILYECQGVLALRHGDRNIAKGNLFIGNGVRNTGGIRIVGEDQQVLGNRFYNLTGARFFAPLAFMCGVPNSLPNRYIQVKRTVLRDNMFSDCAPMDLKCGSDFERTLDPVGTIWENNEICSGAVPPPYASLRQGKGAEWYDAPGAECALRHLEIARDTVLTAGIIVDSPTEIVAAEGTHPVITYAGKKSANMITIEDGGSLVVRGLTFNGKLAEGKALASAGISTAKDMIEPYTLTVEDCSFINFGESGFVPIRGMKGTFADTLTVRNCTFDALSGDGISFAAESDDKGRYNADDMFIENCRFGRILGIPINIYRGGSDESTAGPYVHITGCSFDDSCNKVRGSVIRITGAQVLDIVGCEFRDSGRGGYSIRLDDASWEKINVSNNIFINSGKILSNGNL